MNASICGDNHDAYGTPHLLTFFIASTAWHSTSFGLLRLGGAVHLAGSLGAALTALLRCLHALETYVGGAPLGGARSRPGVRRSQQSLALRVALGPPAQARAAGAQRAAALESALSRAVYVLVHAYGTRAVMAADVPPESVRCSCSASSCW